MDPEERQDNKKAQTNAQKTTLYWSKHHYLAQRTYIHPPIPTNGPRQITIGHYFKPVTTNSTQSTANHHNLGQTTTTTAPETPHNALHTPEFHGNQNQHNDKTQPQSALTALEKGQRPDLK